MRVAQRGRPASSAHNDQVVFERLLPGSRAAPHTFLQPVTRLPLVARGLSESRSDILHTPNFHRDHREAERAGRCLNLTHIQQGDRIAGIGQDR